MIQETKKLNTANSYLQRQKKSVPLSISRIEPAGGWSINDSCGAWATNYAVLGHIDVKGVKHGIIIMMQIWKEQVKYSDKFKWGIDYLQSPTLIFTNPALTILQSIINSICKGRSKITGH